MEQPKTILHLINSLGRGGAETLLKDTIPLLPEYRHVICYLNRPNDFKQDFPGIEVICLHHESKLQTLSSVRQIRGIIRKHNVTIVHAHLLESTWLGRLATMKNVHFVSTIHSTLSKDAFEVNRNSLRIEQLTVSSRQNIIAVSQTVLNDYLKHVAFKGKTFVLHNFVNPLFFDTPKDEYRHDFSPLKLVAVGNLKAAKNYEYVLKALSEIKDIPVQLDIYGGGQYGTLLQKIIDNQKLNVRLMGSRSDINNVLPAYDAYIISSKHEGFGIAPLEAMAKGLPVLASDIPVFREVIGDNALFFDLSNPSSLSESIRNIFHNPKQLEIVAQKGRLQAQKIASTTSYVQKLTSIYQEIAHR